jgi:hypothetical protein
VNAAEIGVGDRNLNPPVTKYHGPLGVLPMEVFPSYRIGLPHGLPVVQSDLTAVQRDPSGGVGMAERTLKALNFHLRTNMVDVPPQHQPPLSPSLRLSKALYLLF